MENNNQLPLQRETESGNSAENIGSTDQSDGVISDYYNEGIQQTYDYHTTTDSAASAQMAADNQTTTTTEDTSGNEVEHHPPIREIPGDEDTSSGGDNRHVPQLTERWTGTMGQQREHNVSNVHQSASGKVNPHNTANNGNSAPMCSEKSLLQEGPLAVKFNYDDDTLSQRSTFSAQIAAQQLEERMSKQDIFNQERRNLGMSGAASYPGGGSSSGYPLSSKEGGFQKVQTLDSLSLTSDDPTAIGNQMDDGDLGKRTKEENPSSGPLTVIPKRILSFLEADRKGRTFIDTAVEMKNEQLIENILRSGTDDEKYLLFETICKKKSDDISDRDREILHACKSGAINFLQEYASSVVTLIETVLNEGKQKMHSAVEDGSITMRGRFEMDMDEYLQIMLDIWKDASTHLSSTLKGSDKVISDDCQNVESVGSTMITRVMSVLSDKGSVLDAYFQIVSAGNETLQQTLIEIFAAVETGGSEFETALKKYSEITSFRARISQIFNLQDSVSLEHSFLQFLEPDPEVSKVKFQENCQTSHMHMTACQRQFSVFKSLRLKMTRDELYQQMSLKIPCKSTVTGLGSLPAPIHMAARFNDNADNVRCLFDPLLVGQKVSLLRLNDGENSTLSVAAKYNKSAAVLKVLLEKLSVSEKVCLLQQIIDRHGRSAIHMAADSEYESAAKLETLLQGIDPETKVELLCVISHDLNRTPVHTAANVSDDPRAVGLLLEGLNTTQRCQVLSMKAKDDSTPLHLAAANIPPVVGRMIEGLAEAELLNLLCSYDNKGSTPLHIAAERVYDSPSIMNVLMQHVSDEKRLELLKQRNSKGMTPTEVAQKLAKVQPEAAAVQTFDVRPKT